MVVVKTKTPENRDLTPENGDPFMILIQELRDTLYGLTDEKHLKLGNFSVRNVIIYQLNRAKLPTITLNAEPEISLFLIIFLFEGFLIYFRKY